MPFGRCPPLIWIMKYIRMLGSCSWNLFRWHLSIRMDNSIEILLSITLSAIISIGTTTIDWPLSLTRAPWTLSNEIACLSSRENILTLYPSTPD